MMKQSQGDKAGLSEGDSMDKRRILLAEDDEAVRDMLQRALERDGFEVVTATNVSEALNLIATQDFHVLLSDMHMPHAGDGFTVVSAMRHTHPRAVTIVLSGYPALEEAMSAILLQADEVLTKPIELASLIYRKIKVRSRLKPCRLNQRETGLLTFRRTATTEMSLVPIVAPASSCCPCCPGAGPTRSLA
jgi:DNA-binding NtrC family response regulator